MPNLLAHYLLVKRFSLKYKEIESNYPNFHSFLDGNFDYLSLGTQGPDPLFYMGIIPFRGLHLPTAMKKVGNQIHKTDAKKYFRYLIQQCYSIDDTQTAGKEILRFKAFIFGQFAHYLLDRECHPYILYKSGFDKNGKIKGKYHYQHAYFESKLDFCLSEKYKMDHFLEDPQDILPNHPMVLKTIDRNFVPVLKQTFDLKKLPKNMYSNGLKNFRFWLKYTNHGTRARVFFFGKTNLSATRLPKVVSEDVLNEKRDVWLDPVSGEKHNESFLELHSRVFVILSSLYEDIMKKGFNYETFSKYIDGRNYYGEPLDQKWVYKEENK